MIRQPADNEDEHNHHHHFYNLKLEQYFNKTGQQGEPGQEKKTRKEFKRISWKEFAALSSQHSSK